MFFDPERQAKIEAAKEAAGRRWRTALIAIVFMLLGAAYLWGYSDGMSADGYTPGATIARKEP